MSIATRNQFWGARLNGEDPTNPDTPETFSNTAWTLEAGSDAADGSASNGWWVINADSGGQMWKSGLAAATSYTLFALFKITNTCKSFTVY